MAESVQQVDIWRLYVDDQEHRLKIDIERLAQSILTTGQIAPIIVVKDKDQFRVVAGRRRYAALKYIQEELKPTEKIKALVMVTDLDKLHQEIIKIDENIMRQQLTGAELDEALFRRQQIYQELHPETKQHSSGGYAKSAKAAGVKKKGAPAFTQDAANRLQVSRRKIEKSIARAAKATEAVKKAREAGQIQPSKVDLLVTLPPKDQDLMLALVKERDLAESKLLIEQAKRRGAKAVQLILNEAVPEHAELKRLRKEVDELTERLGKYIQQDKVFKGEERWQDIKAFDKLAKQLERFINFQKANMGHVRAIHRRGDSRREIFEVFRG